VFSIAELNLMAETDEAVNEICGRAINLPMLDEGKSIPMQVLQHMNVDWKARMEKEDPERDAEACAKLGLCLTDAHGKPFQNRYQQVLSSAQQMSPLRSEPPIKAPLECAALDLERWNAPDRRQRRPLRGASSMMHALNPTRR